MVRDQVSPFGFRAVVNYRNVHVSDLQCSTPVSEPFLPYIPAKTALHSRILYSMSQTTYQQSILRTNARVVTARLGTCRKMLRLLGLPASAIRAPVVDIIVLASNMMTLL